MRSNRKENINPLDVFVTRRMDLTPDDVARIGADLLAHPNKTDEPGLTATLLLKLYGDAVPAEQKEPMRTLLDEAQKNSQLVKDIGVSLTTLDQQTGSYFPMAERAKEFGMPPPPDSSYFSLEPFGHPLADTILKLKCTIRAGELQQEFTPEQKKAGYLAEPFPPETGRPGVWMSTKGIHFDRTQLRAA